MLWSHIDIIPGFVATTGLLTRTKTLLALAGQSPLELHISGEAELDQDPRPLPDKSPFLSQLLSSIAPRLQSLELVAELFTDFHLSILRACLVNCTPGMLTRLIIHLPNNFPLSPESNFAFFEASENANAYDSLLIDMKQEDLEALWLPIKTLSLCGIYPRWSSKAYHGLVELQLRDLHPDSDMLVTITEAQLAGILKSSPQLRVLRFGMEIKYRLRNDALITPVCLDSLEVLDLSAAHPEQNGTILRWIRPGPNPPVVALNFGHSKALLSDETKPFLLCSHTTKLAIIGPTSNDWSPNLLSLSPDIQTLVLKDLPYACNGHGASQTPPFPAEYELPPIGFRPDYLHIIICTSVVELGWLRQVLERRPIKMLTIWCCDFQRNPHLARVSDDEVERELLQVCPVVRILDRNQPNPIKDWNLL